jgi:Tetratricopeptide repeat
VKSLTFAALCLALAWLAESSSMGQGRPGGGRPAPQPAPQPVTPAFNRPAPRPAPAPRPNVRPPSAPRPGFVPAPPGGAVRPSVAPPRPTPGGVAQPGHPVAPGMQRPGPENRPGVQVRPPAASRPAPGFIQPGAGNRPAAGGPIPRPGVDRPAPGVINRPNLPGSGPRPNLNRPMPGDLARPYPGVVNRPGTRPGPFPTELQRPGLVIRPGAGNRPGVADRPDTNRPGRPGGRPDRPGFLDRPDRPSLAGRPDRPIRPGFGRPDVGRPNFIQRPGLNVGDRHTSNTVNVNRWNQFNRQWNANPSWWNRPANWNRPWYAGRPVSYWGRPYSWQHWNWHHGYWNYWQAPPALWYGGGVAAGWLLSPGDAFVYGNPYYVQPPPTEVVVPGVLDYSTPLPAPSADEAVYAYPPGPSPADGAAVDPAEPLPTTAPPAPATDDPAVSAANAAFDQAREAFKRGDSAQARALVERAITSLPSDGTLHEFRALTLFTQGKHREAAAALYAVLAAGPGWDWPTMAALYPDVDTYARQLHALEDYVGQRPTEGDSRFLLAYHYLVLGHKGAAVRELTEVVRLVPRDTLSAALLKALTTGDAVGAPPAPEAAR